MTDNNRRTGPGPVGKPGPGPGISRTEFDDLRKKISELEGKLLEALAEKNLWNHTLRKWQEEEKQVTFSLLTGGQVVGKIEWIDRYTIGVASNGDTIIVHKGAIATIKR